MQNYLISGKFREKIVKFANLCRF